MSAEKIDINKLLLEYRELPEFSGMVLDSVNQKGDFGSTPLHIAIYRQRLSEVQALIAAGADVNAPGEYGERPLQVAVNTGSEPIVEALLQAGAKCDLEDDQGQNTWQWAEGFGFTAKLQEITGRVGINRSQSSAIAELGAVKSPEHRFDVSSPAGCIEFAREVLRLGVSLRELGDRVSVATASQKALGLLHRAIGLAKELNQQELLTDAERLCKVVDKELSNDSEGEKLRPL